ncbi:hypothetical protein S40293_08286 [Stachybotrys chartarum IBT 40293]|nr:hypothetical protein S40293_08286 [Stachybotrys chartarum IBT 40293]KFA81968.1 hypothetical protein S40288_04386 [Stachybotrys chartarum IBT 40288]
MPTCRIQAQPDMYGLGIRTAFYIQWFGAVLIEWLDETDLDDMRLLGLLLSGALIIGLIVQVAEEALQAAEIYIVLLLASGIYIFLVPLYIWRALTLFSPYWNPFRWSKEKHSPIFRFSNFVVLVLVASMGTWFYVTYLPGLDAGCSQYGFFFGSVSLGSDVYIAFNAILYIVILVVCAFLLLTAIGCEINVWPRRRRKAHRMHIETVRGCRNLSNVIVFGVLIAGVELSVEWNDLQATSQVTTAAQTIPLVVSAGFVCRSIFLYFVRQQGGDDDSDGSSVVHTTQHGQPSITTTALRPVAAQQFPVEAMASKEAPKDKDKSKVHKLSLKGSAKLVAEFFQYSIHTILFQRGVYPAEDFTAVKKYGLNMLGMYGRRNGWEYKLTAAVSADDQVKAYIKKIMGQLDRWMVGGKISKLVIVITDKDTGEHVERWQFDVQIFQPTKPSKKSSSKPTTNQENTAAPPPTVEKTEAEIQSEIAAIFRQITASVTFLPQLSGDCTFNVLVYADADSDVPVDWGDSDGKEIENAERVQLRGFSTANHRVDTLVSYRLGD